MCTHQMCFEVISYHLGALSLFLIGKKKVVFLFLVPLAVSSLCFSFPPFFHSLDFPLPDLKERNWKNVLSCQKEAIVSSHRQTLIG